MSGSFGGSSTGGVKKARIEIIPLIDVIFFLLATFVLFTLSLDKIQSVPVDLPQASAAPRSPVDEEMVVLQISETGTAYWNKEPISFADIPHRLLDYKATTPTPRVLISGDDKASYGDAVLALDEARKAGVVVSIETAFRATGR
jgi:biopolymer transport protein ExbD